MKKVIGIKVCAILITIVSVLYIRNWISNWHDLVAHTSTWGRCLSFSILLGSAMLCFSAPGLFFLKERSRIIALISVFILFIPFLIVVVFPLFGSLISGNWHSAAIIFLSGLIYASICYLSPIVLFYLTRAGTKDLFK